MKKYYISKTVPWLNIYVYDVSTGIRFVYDLGEMRLGIFGGDTKYLEWENNLESAYSHWLMYREHDKGRDNKRLDIGIKEIEKRMTIIELSK